MTKPFSCFILLLGVLLSACTEEEKSNKENVAKTTQLQASFAKPVVALKSPVSGVPYAFGIKDCQVYKSVQTQNKPADWKLLFKPAFYPLPKRCIVERLEMEGEYLQIEIGTQALGVGGCCTTYAAYRTQNGETWEIRPATSIKEWQTLNGNNKQLDTSAIKGDPITGTGMSPVDLKTHADNTAKALINKLGQQQTSAMLGWQVEPDYWPMQHCFDYWYDTVKTALDKEAIKHCEQHVKDLSRLYASYQVEAWPVLFKSKYYWKQQDQFGLDFPRLVKEWEAAGGSKDDASFLKHPNCAKPLQSGWTGSDFFWDGREHSSCRFYKMEALQPTLN